jgi:hypothetical protein
VQRSSVKKVSLVVLVLACLFVVAAPKALAWWNTGLTAVYNQSYFPIVLKVGRRELTRIEGYSARDTFGYVIPWCNNAQELKDKAIGVYDTYGTFYGSLCQNYADNIVYYVRPGESWEHRIQCGSGPFSYINLTMPQPELGKPFRLYCYG